MKRINKFSDPSIFSAIIATSIILSTFISYQLSLWIRSILPWNFLTPIEGYNIKAIESLTWLILLSSMVLIDYFKLTRQTFISINDILKRSMKYAVLQTLITTAMAYYFREFSFPRSIITFGFILIFLFTSLIMIVVKLNYSPTTFGNKLLIIGDNHDDISLMTQKVQKYFPQIGSVMTETSMIFLSDDVKTHIFNSTSILICASLNAKLKDAILLESVSQDKVAYVMPDFSDVVIWKSPLVQFGDKVTFQVDRLCLSFEQRFVKRTFDIVFSILIIFLVWPIMLVTYIVVRSTSPGPAIFNQERLTINNRKFKIYKFRTMVVDSEKESGPVFSSLNDERVTKVGRFLRKFKIDELPQLINVLKGEMSIVGPRSEREYFVNRFSDQVPGYSNRFKVKAGITGYAQIAGHYNTTPDDKLRFDLAYINNYSLLLDLQIILQTVRIFFRLDRLVNW